MRSGPSAGTFVPLASIVVTDHSGLEMKVVLWRRAAFWALTLSPGDILLVSGTWIQPRGYLVVIRRPDAEQQKAPEGEKITPEEVRLKGWAMKHRKTQENNNNKKHLEEHL